jgi:hypothetical protein
MKSYRITSAVRRSPFILSVIALLVLAALIFLCQWSFEGAPTFLILSTIVLTCYSSWKYFSLRAEAVIIEEGFLTYKRLTKQTRTPWQDIVEFRMLTGWSSKPEIILKGASFSLQIDIYSFENGKDLLQDIKTHLSHIHLAKGYEFTEF